MAQVWDPAALLIWEWTIKRNKGLLALLNYLMFLSSGDIMDNPDSVNDDVTPEDGENAELEQLKSELDLQKIENKKLMDLADTYLDSARRIKAEFENYQKRTAREKEETTLHATGKVVSDMLPLLDDLERALSVQCSLDEFKEGISKIYLNMLAVFKEYGLKEIPAEIFDPTYHEAFSVGEGEDGKILEVYQKGYLLGPKVLRCSKVKVAKETGENNG